MLLLSVLLAAAPQPSPPPAPKLSRNNVLIVLPMLDSIQEWSDDWRKVAEGLARAQVRNWTECIAAQKAVLRRSTEPANIVADAIIAACSEDERLAQQAIAGSYRGEFPPDDRRDIATAQVAGLRKAFRDEAFAEIVRERVPRRR